MRDNTRPFPTYSHGGGGATPLSTTGSTMDTMEHMQSSAVRPQ